MPRGKAEQAEVIIPKLREVEVDVGRGKTVAEAVKKIGVTKQTDCRWKKKLGGLRIDQMKRQRVAEPQEARQSVTRDLQTVSILSTTARTIRAMSVNAGPLSTEPSCM